MKSFSHFLNIVKESARLWTVFEVPEEKDWTEVEMSPIKGHVGYKIENLGQTYVFTDSIDRLKECVGKEIKVKYDPTTRLVESFEVVQNLNESIKASDLERILEQFSTFLMEQGVEIKDHKDKIQKFINR